MGWKPIEVAKGFRWGEVSAGERAVNEDELGEREEGEEGVNTECGWDFGL